MGDNFNTIHHYKANIHWSSEVIKLNYYWNKTFQDQNDNNLQKRWKTKTAKLQTKHLYPLPPKVSLKNVNQILYTIVKINQSKNIPRFFNKKKKTDPL